MKEKGRKLVPVFIFTILIILLVLSSVSAGFFDRIKKTITGKATSPVSVNISVGGPEIRNVFNETMMTDVSGGINQGPSSTVVQLNFSVYLAAGIINLNHSTATINYSQVGQDTRQNTTCARLTDESDTNLQNYSCYVDMWWWDAQGTWDITAIIKDNSSNTGTNTSKDFQVGPTTSFDVTPPTLNWSGLSPGSINQTPTNQPMILNNTGNVGIGISSRNISVNITNLKGETTATQALWAKNMTIGWDTGSSAECDYSISATNVTNSSYVNVTMANLTAGNYTQNNKYTGQEELYFCINIIGTELSNQAYSTVSEGTWTIQI